MEEITLEVSNLLTFTKAAEMLGVSRPTVYNFVNRQQLHPVTIGRNRYLLRHEVERLKQEINNQATEQPMA
ncbi:hypothetical protein ES707_16494 [subsurface metagenome]|jgi:excisionase family DNA binding protein